MRGLPRTRVSGLDARWEYTLYDGGGDEPFVHALDTVAGRAICIDMPWLDRRGIWRTDLELSEDGTTVTVLDSRDGPVAEIDTATHEATGVDAAASAAPVDAAIDGTVAAMIAIAVGCVGGAAALGLRRRRRGARARDGLPAEPPVAAGR